MRRLGVEGRIKSPTYTLVEPYVVEIPKSLESRQNVKLDCYHFDFYRARRSARMVGRGFSGPLRRCGTPPGRMARTRRRRRRLAAACPGSVDHVRHRRAWAHGAGPRRHAAGCRVADARDRVARGPPTLRQGRPERWARRRRAASGVAVDRRPLRRTGRGGRHRRRSGLAGQRIHARHDRERSSRSEAAHFLVEGPDRLVVDVDGLKLDAALRDLRREGAAERSLHPPGPRRPEPAERRADRARPEGPREPAGLQPRAGRRIPLSTGLRPLPGPGRGSAARVPVETRRRDPHPAQRPARVRARRPCRPGIEVAAEARRRNGDGGRTRHPSRSRRGVRDQAAGGHADDHDRARSRSRRRGSGCHREQRQPREGRRPRDREAGPEEARRGAEHALHDDSRRGLLRAAQRARAEGASGAGGPVRIDPCGRVRVAGRAWVVGVRAVRTRRDVDRGEVAGEQGERRRP